MHFQVIATVVALLQVHEIGSGTSPGVGRDKETIVKPPRQIKKDECNCDISSKYIDIDQINRADIEDACDEEIVEQLNGTLDGNYKIIYDIMSESECNFSYIQRGLKNVQQRVIDIIEIFKCPEQRQNKDLLDAAVDVFVCAKDSMIADMRSASPDLSQECADLFTKIRPAACNTGENIIFAVLNSLHK